MENDILSIKSQMDQLLNLEEQMADGFTSLDNRMTMMQAHRGQKRQNRPKKENVLEQKRRTTHPEPGAAETRTTGALWQQPPSQTYKNDTQPTNANDRPAKADTMERERTTQSKT